MDGTTILDLAEGLQLRRARVMGAYRMELAGFTEPMRDRLRAYGLFSEIISWKLRLFVPADATGPAVLAKLLDTLSGRARLRAGGRVMARQNASDLAHRLGRQAEAVCRHYLSSGRRAGRLLAGGRRSQHARALDVCPAQRLTQGPRRQMDGLCCAGDYVASLRRAAVLRGIGGFCAT